MHPPGLNPTKSLSLALTAASTQSLDIAVAPSPVASPLASPRLAPPRPSSSPQPIGAIASWPRSSSVKRNRKIFFFMESTQEECSANTLFYMELALQQAKLALDALEVPVGCVILEDGKVIASGRNRTNETRNATRHAEMEAIDLLLEQWQKDSLSPPEVAEKFSKCVLYVTCEPCIMCASALSFLGLKEVYYGCANDKFGGCGSVLSMHLGNTETETSNGEEARLGKGFKCTGGIMASQAVSLFRNFYEQGNPNAPKPHRPVVQRGMS